MKISQEEWKSFLKLQKDVLILFLFAMVSSSIYAIYLLRNNQLPSGYLAEYLFDGTGDFNIKHVLLVFLMYFKRCMLVWIMGIFSFMVPFALCLVYLYIFAYGFSITWLLVSFGIRGIGVGIMNFGIQGILMIGFLLYLSSAILEKNKVFDEGIRVSYPIYLLLGVVISLIVSIVECLIGVK